jgi:hypothetical protein
MISPIGADGSSMIFLIYNKTCSLKDRCWKMASALFDVVDGDSIGDDGPIAPQDMRDTV